MCLGSARRFCVASVLFVTAAAASGPDRACAQSLGEPDEPQSLDIGVEYRYYRHATPPVHVIVVDRSTRGIEFRILADERSERAGIFDTHRVSQLASTHSPVPIVSVNGSFWTSPACADCWPQGHREDEPAVPVGMLVLNGDERVAPTGPTEWVMGFARSGARVDVHMFRARDRGLPDNARYLHYALGSPSCVLHPDIPDSACPDDTGDPDRPRSAIAYDANHVYLMSGDHGWRGSRIPGSNVSQYRSLLRELGATHGLLLDGGYSAQMVIGAGPAPVNPIPLLSSGFFFFNSARFVANAVGLVRTGAACLDTEYYCGDDSDDDCNGLTDCEDPVCGFDVVCEVCRTPDVDRDGHDAGGCGGDDCDDNCAACHPGATELCDGTLRDENCDGMVDEGCACRDGTARPCGTDVGECTAGTQTCAGGTWTASCSGSVSPRPEVCNGLDDDCDGSADETFTCVQGATMACSATCGPGTRTCSADCSAWESCVGPMGMCPPGALESRPCGSCSMTESRTCSPSCAWGPWSGCSCPVAETCNGVDDDGNGIVDDPDICWRTIYRFRDGTTGARCLSKINTGPPLRCLGYGYEIEAFIIPRTPVPGTYFAVQCSSMTDHIVVEQGGADYITLMAAGYDCSYDLGYVFRSAPPYTGRWTMSCPLYRFSDRLATDAGLGGHIFTRGPEALTSLTCEPPTRGYVLTSVACFGGVPACCSGGSPMRCL